MIFVELCSGEALRHRILKAETISFLFVVVALSMALTPFMAEFGQRLGKKFDRGDMKASTPLSNLHCSRPTAPLNPNSLEWPVGVDQVL